jgi:hypothetical protein
MANQMTTTALLLVAVCWLSAATAQQAAGHARAASAAEVSIDTGGCPESLRGCSSEAETPQLTWYMPHRGLWQPHQRIWQQPQPPPSSTLTKLCTHVCARTVCRTRGHPPLPSTAPTCSTGQASARIRSPPHRLTFGTFCCSTQLARRTIRGLLPQVRPGLWFASTFSGCRRVEQCWSGRQLGLVTATACTDRLQP